MTALSSAQSARLIRCPVLILTGNKFTGQLVRQLFFGLGMRDIAIAPDPAEARERLGLSRLDLVVADTGPATYDPLDSLVSLRSITDEHQAHVPVILLVTPNLSVPTQLSAVPNVAQVVKPLSNKPFTDAVLRCLFHIDGVEETSPMAAPLARERKTTLILSANPYTVQVVRALLLTLGLADIAVAKDKEDALAKVAKTHYDFVVADHGLGAFDTLEFIAGRRNEKGGPLSETPTLLLSADPSAALVSRAREAQIQTIIPKPIDAEAFTRRVARVLGLAR
jgi:CheY-like chemotaxis protein